MCHKNNRYDTQILIGQLTKNFHSSEFMCNDPAETVVPAYYTANMVYLAVQLQKNSRFLKS